MIGAVMGAITLATSAVTAGMKYAAAKRQEREAKQLLEANPRPTYNIPKPIQQSTDIARMMSLQGLPGQALMQDQLRQTSASGVRAATDLAQDPATKAAIAAGLYSQEMGAINQLNIQDANFRVAGQERLMGAYNILAQYQDKEFDYNKAQPYDNAMAAASALTGASMQNRMTATEDILGGVSSAALGINSQMKNNALDSMQQKQSEAASKAANIGMGPAVETALGGLGTATSPTVVTPQGNTSMANFMPPEGFDVTTASEQDFLALPQFFDFAGQFPGRSTAEIIDFYKQVLGY